MRSPGEESVSGSPEGEKAEMAMPRAFCWISPLKTGDRGEGAPKRDIMSVPPVMLPRLMSGPKAAYTYWNVLGARGEPVE